MHRPFAGLLLSLAVPAVLAALAATAAPASAHPMPHTVALMDVHPDRVDLTLELPAADLQLARGATSTGMRVGSLVDDDADAVRAYLAEHIVAAAVDGERWTTTVGSLSLTQAEQTSTGPYQEVVAEVTLEPPAGADVRRFTLDYDAIVHQVVTHIVLVSLRQDWSTGQLPEDRAQQVGVIRTDTVTGQVPPLDVDLDSAHAWSGFASMVGLGASHIREGTDHLLFLLTLMLPAPLLLAGRGWGGFAGPRRSASTMLAITLAFTAGHSLTLAVSAVTQVQLPVRPIESLIAFSIVVSAVHALRPIYGRREALIAGLFGLVHGMAFSFILNDLDLATPQLLLSLLGFNLGIELFQLAVLAIVLSSLVVLARTRLYTPLRVTGAAVTGLAAVGWLADRLGRPNPIARGADHLGDAGGWFAAALAALAVAAALQHRRSSQPEIPNGSQDNHSTCSGVDDSHPVPARRHSGAQV